MENEKIEINNVEEMPTQKASIIDRLKKNIKIIVPITFIAFLLIASIPFVLNKGTDQTVKKNTEIKESPVGNVYITPANIVGKFGETYTTSIVANTGGKKISSATISVKYNPNLFEYVILIPYRDNNSALFYSLIQTKEQLVDPQNGTISLSLELPKDYQPLAGVGTIAELRFKLKKLNVAIKSTDISILESSGFLTSDGMHTNINKNQLIITLPAGTADLSKTPLQK